MFHLVCSDLSFTMCYSMTFQNNDNRYRYNANSKGPSLFRNLLPATNKTPHDYSPQMREQGDTSNPLSAREIFHKFISKNSYHIYIRQSLSKETKPSLVSYSIIHLLRLAFQYPSVVSNYYSHTRNSSIQPSRSFYKECQLDNTTIQHAELARISICTSAVTQQSVSSL